MSAPVPSLPTVLAEGDVRRTAAAIAHVQEPDGAVPWYRGGHVDPWDHVEAAMGLLIGGEVAAAERAYDWLAATQRPDGSWPMRVAQGRVVDAGTDSNACAYLAAGVWHHWLVRHDEQFVRRTWPTVRRALDRVVALQLPFGGIAWAVDATGRAADTALVSGSASIHHALACGLALAELVDEPQPEWELAGGRLGHALREHEDLFEPKRRYSMDWYYPVLGGALRGPSARARLAERWPEFVVDGLGIRCVHDRPWVTGAETCELVLALDAADAGSEEVGDAAELLRAMQHLRDPDAAYWTGYVFADDARWPVERSTWTAGAVILAVDALSRTTGGSGIFRGDGLRLPLPEVALECGCRPAEVASRPR